MKTCQILITYEEGADKIGTEITNFGVPEQLMKDGLIDVLFRITTEQPEYQELVQQ